jgi:hypothetical protein
MRAFKTFLDALAGPMVQTILVLRILVKLHESLTESMKAQLEVGFALATDECHSTVGKSPIADTTLELNAGSCPF